MIIFSDLLNEFQILDYSPTHSQLLLRSMKNQGRNYNIDILIKGVLVIVVPTQFIGIEISVKESDENQEKFGYKMTKDYKILLFENKQGKQFIVNAMCFGIYHNKLEILETSIGRYDRGNLGENVLWYS